MTNTENHTNCKTKDQRTLMHVHNKCTQAEKDTFAKQRMCIKRNTALNTFFEI